MTYLYVGLGILAILALVWYFWDDIKVRLNDLPSSLDLIKKNGPERVSSVLLSRILPSSYGDLDPSKPLPSPTHADSTSSSFPTYVDPTPPPLPPPPSPPPAYVVPPPPPPPPPPPSPSPSPAYVAPPATSPPAPAPVYLDSRLSLPTLYVEPTPPQPLPPTYKYVGCYRDRADPNRAFPNYVANASIKDCAEIARKLNHRAFGIQYSNGVMGVGKGGECWVGDDSKYKSYAISNSCPLGSDGYYYGDSWVNAVYEWDRLN